MLPVGNPHSGKRYPQYLYSTKCSRPDSLKNAYKLTRGEKKNPQKLGKRFEQALHTKGYLKGQWAYGNVFNTITHQ